MSLSPLVKLPLLYLSSRSSTIIEGGGEHITADSSVLGILVMEKTSWQRQATMDQSIWKALWISFTPVIKANLVDNCSLFEARCSLYPIKSRCAMSGICPWFVRWQLSGLLRIDSFIPFKPPLATKEGTFDDDKLSPTSRLYASSWCAMKWDTTLPAPRQQILKDQFFFVWSLQLLQNWS